MRRDGTTCVWAARPAVQALRERAIDAAPVLRAAGLSAHAVDSVEARLPFDAVAALWDAAATAARDPWFGLHVAARAPRGSCDVVEYLGSASRTLGEAWERITRYERLFYDLSNLRVVVEPRHARLVHRSPVTAVQLDEFLYGYLVVRGRQWIGVDFALDVVRFQHAAPPRSGRMPSLFRCRVEFAARAAEICLPRAPLALPVVHADSHLLDILARYADAQLAALRAPGDVAGRATASIARQLGTAAPTLSSTARALAMSPRALQRRLAACGLSFRALADDVRRDLALKYIVHAGMSIADIAYLLHFSDGTAFDRAFKRWTGETPLAYRSRAL